jgi:hypothetical protein
VTGDCELNAGLLRPAAQLAGICGYKRVSPASARAADVQLNRARVHKDNRTCGFAGIYGAYRDRTGDLRLAKLYSALRAEPGRAGITDESRDFVPRLAGIFGNRRRPPATSCGMYAGCGRCLGCGTTALRPNVGARSRRRGPDLYAGLVGGPAGPASQQWRAHSAGASSAAPSSQARANASAVSAWRHSASRVSASA